MLELVPVVEYSSRLHAVHENEQERVDEAYDPALNAYPQGREVLRALGELNAPHLNVKGTILVRPEEPNEETTVENSGILDDTKGPPRGKHVTERRPISIKLRDP